VAKTPTVYDVAERAGVSIATVSFTFRRPEKVRDSTRLEVLAAARALGYVPNGNARGLAHGRTGALGLYSYDYLLDPLERLDGPGSTSVEGGAGVTAVSDDSNEDLRLFPLYVDEVQRGVELECWRRGYALMVSGGSRAGSEEIVADIAGRVDGLAVFPRTVPDDVLRHISRRIPVVEVSEPSHDDGLDHVTVDNDAGMRALTEHMISGHGLRHLLFVGRLATSDSEARFNGFRSALRAAGLRVSRHPVSHRRGIAQPAAVIVRDLLAREALPEGLVCATDQEALAVMAVLAEAGVAVPGRVAVTGFDGIAAGRIVRPTLTTVRQPMEQLGRATVDILLARLAHPEEAPASRQLPVRLVLRESCGCRP
jgi:LacI family transcriptional regulator